MQMHLHSFSLPTYQPMKTFFFFFGIRNAAHRRVPLRAEGVELQRFIDIPNSARAPFDALSLGARTFLINAEHLFFFSSLPLPSFHPYLAIHATHY